jgi:putative transposase
MPRTLRVSAGGLGYHVLNCSNGRLAIFERPADYELFEQVLAEAHERAPMRTVSYCLMPNHWHLVLWPRRDGELSAFMRWLTMTHTQRWHAARGTAGSGHIYQGRFKSFPIQADRHFLTVCRYVERNALRAGLVGSAQEWRWCSLWRRRSGDAEAAALLSDGPVPWPEDWLRIVNRPQRQGELEALRRCVVRGRPFGGEVWVARTARRLGLLSTLQPRGRPRKDTTTRAKRRKGS